MFKGAFLIGTKFQSDMLRCYSVVGDSCDFTKDFYKQQSIKESVNVFTCMQVPPAAVPGSADPDDYRWKNFHLKEGLKGQHEFSG